jgi:hypothetical protein
MGSLPSCEESSVYATNFRYRDRYWDNGNRRKTAVRLSSSIQALHRVFRLFLPALRHKHPLGNCCLSTLLSPPNNETPDPDCSTQDQNPGMVRLQLWLGPHHALTGEQDRDRMRYRSGNHDLSLYALNESLGRRKGWITRIALAVKGEFRLASRLDAFPLHPKPRSCQPCDLLLRMRIGG